MNIIESIEFATKVLNSNQRISRRNALKIGAVPVVLAAASCVEIPPAKYTSVPTPTKLEVIPIGGDIPFINDNGRYYAIAKLLADPTARNAVSDKDREYYNEQTKAFNEKMMRRQEPELWAYADTLPRKMGIVSWDGYFTIYGGSGGFVNPDVHSSTKVDLIDVKIPISLSAEQKIIVLKKEILGTMLAINYVIPRLDPLIPTVKVPAGQRAVLTDGLAALTLTPEERVKIGLNNSGLKITLSDGSNAKILEDYLVWDGKRDINNDDMAAIAAMSRNKTIVTEGVAYYTSEIKKLIAKGILK